MSLAALNFVEPQQQRSRDALLRIYGATNRLLDEAPFDRITMAQIAGAADVSVGSIYQRFGSKDDLLWALYEIYLSEAEEHSAALAKHHEPDPLSKRTERVVALVCALFRTHRGTVRSLLIKYRQTPDAIPEAFLGRVDAVYNNIIAFLQDGAAGKQVSGTVPFCFSMIMSACRDHILFNEPYGLDVSENGDAVFIRTLSDAANVLVKGE